MQNIANYTARRVFFAVVMLAGMAVGSNGCRPAGDGTKDAATREPRDAAGLAASEILQRTLAAYANTAAYHDQASLHLTYRLEGRWMEEPHPWMVTMMRDGRMAASIYTARLQSTGEVLTCFVYDFPTGNLDGQLWTRPVENRRWPLAALMDDSIAQYYVSGQSELPLSATHPLSHEALFPPTMWWLMGQPDPVWGAAEHVERLDDKQLDGRPCWRIATTRDGETFVMWIDQATQLVSQIELPNGLLDPRITTSPAVTDLTLVARFHSATVNPSPHVSLAMPQLDEPRPVSQFVAIPEPFPTAAVGHELSTLSTGRPVTVLAADGTPIDVAKHSDRSLALIMLDPWTATALAHDRNEPNIDDPQDASQRWDWILRVAAELQSDAVDGVIVVPSFADGLTAGAASSQDDLARLLATRLESQRVAWPVWKDVDASLSATLGLRPGSAAAVVFSAQDRLEYAAYLGTAEWNPDFADIVRRVVTGDQVAEEMFREYEQFVHDYQVRLDAAAVDSAGQSIAADSLVTNATPADGAKRRLAFTRLWTSESLRAPGNLLALRQVKPAWVLDGFQTLAAIEPSGQSGSTVRLPIGDDAAIDRLTAWQGADGAIIAGWGQESRRVYVFDSSWRIVADYSDSIVANASDVELGQFTAAGPIELVVLSRDERTIRRATVDDAAASLSDAIELEAVDLATIANPALSRRGSAEYVGPPVRLLALLPTGAIAVFDEWRSPPRSIAWPTMARTWKPRQLVSGPADRRQACVTATNANGQTMAMGLSSDLAWTWRQPIGDQTFENSVQSITAIAWPAAEAVLWAAADSTNHVTVWTVQPGDDSAQVAQIVPASTSRFASEVTATAVLDVGQPIRGLALELGDGGQPRLLISTPSEVVAWSIE